MKLHYHLSLHFGTGMKSISNWWCRFCIMQNRWSKSPRAASTMALTASYRVVEFLICIFIMRSIRLSINRKEQILVWGLLLVTVLCSISAWQVYSNGRRRIRREIPTTDSEQNTSIDFLIIGAQFCGTEYLQKLLSRHPLLNQCKNGILPHDQVIERGVFIDGGASKKFMPLSLCRYHYFQTI